MKLSVTFFYTVLKVTANYRKIQLLLGAISHLAVVAVSLRYHNNTTCRAAIEAPKQEQIFRRYMFKYSMVLIKRLLSYK